VIKLKMKFAVVLIGKSNIILLIVSIKYRLNGLQCQSCFILR